MFAIIEQSIGIYPVVDSSEWVNKLAPTVSTIQLRIKNQSKQEIEQEIKKSVAIANRFNLQLFVNDWWQLAIKHGAYGVHLGQEDLEEANIKAIQDANLHLGISTHNPKEIDIALAVMPSYIALGPVFFTNSKPMKDDPLGVVKLSNWVQLINGFNTKNKSNIKTVAIGGINAGNIAQVATSNPTGFAMISAITESANWQKSISELQQQIT